MTKMIKMSLIAAVAVTGITSTVSAQPLEEAIKGVDVSGMLRYRYNDTKTDSTTQLKDELAVNNGFSKQTNEYVFEVNAKSKVNDIVTANVSIVAQGVNNAGGAGAGNNATDDSTGDVDVMMVVEQANFSANLGFATVIAGKQNIPGPMVDTTDVTRQGTGAVALIPVGGVTIAAGHFVNTDIAAGVNATELAVIGKIGDISADVWYADVADVKSGISAHLNATVAGVNVDARHTTMSYDGSALDDATLTKIVASTKIGAATVVAGYAMTGEDNSAANIMSVDGDNDAQSDFRVWQHSVGKLPDATAILVGAGMDVMPDVNVDVKYATVDFGASSDASELLVGATYKMSKNFTAHVRYSMADTDSVDTTAGRLELKYTF